MEDVSKEKIAGLKIKFSDVAPDGFQKEIHQETGYSIDWVHKTLTGKAQPNKDIVRAALKRIKANIETSKRFLQQFESKA